MGIGLGARVIAQESALPALLRILSDRDHAEVAGELLKDIADQAQRAVAAEDRAAKLLADAQKAKQQNDEKTKELNALHAALAAREDALDKKEKSLQVREAEQREKAERVRRAAQELAL